MATSGTTGSTSGLPPTITSYVSSAAERKTGSAKALGKDDFLKLLLVQLENQDPQNPADEKEMIAQLAQFSSLEQMANLNTSFAELKASMEQQGRVSLLAAVGRNARLAGDGLVEDSAGQRNGAYTLDENAANVTVTVSDDAGITLRTFLLGPKTAGEHAFSWDGTLATGARATGGPFHYQVEAFDSKGTSIGATTYTEGRITGISLDEEPLAFIGGFAVPFSSLKVLTEGSGS